MGYNLNDVIRIDFYQEYLDQQIMNSLYYKIIEVVAGAITEAVVDQLAAIIVALIKDLASDSLTHVGQTAYNLSDGITVSNFSNTAVGTVVTGEDLASFISVGMKKSVASRITRPGTIRFSGVKESSTQDNSLTTSAAATYTSVGTALGGEISATDSGNTVKFQHVVVGRNTDGSYNLARVNNVMDTILPRVTTQNSRKYWRGT